MKYQRFAVLGANSFAGQAFISRIVAEGGRVIGFNRSAEGAEIFLPYRKLETACSYKFIQADINHDLDLILTSIDKFQPEVIVDFAGQGMVAESWESPEQWYSTNIVSKVRLHNELRVRKWLRRYIKVSTPEVYGSQSNLCAESWDYRPSTPYAVSHAAIDMSLRAFQQRYDFPVIFTRFANFYGPGQQLYRIIPRTIIYGFLGKTLQLQGGGASKRAFVFGTDVADGILRAAERGSVGESYHFSPTRFLSIRQVVEIICERMNIVFDSLIEVTPERPSQDQAYMMDANKARKMLHWQDSVSFEQGIDLTIDWVRLSLDKIRKLPLNYTHKE